MIDLLNRSLGRNSISTRITNDEMNVKLIRFGLFIRFYKPIYALFGCKPVSSSKPCGLVMTLPCMPYQIMLYNYIQLSGYYNPHVLRARGAESIAKRGFSGWKTAPGFSGCWLGIKGIIKIAHIAYLINDLGLI